MREGSFQALTAKPQQTQAACAANVPTIAVHRSAPGDPALGVDAFEVANQQQSEIDPGGASWGGRPIVAA